MSKAVVHMGKYSAGAVTGIQLHNQREKGKSNTNPDIDWSKTKYNYDLHNEEEIKFQTQVKKRIKELNLPKAVRKDAVVLCEFIVTSDKEFFDELKYHDNMSNAIDYSGFKKDTQKEYFKEAYEFFCNRYGKENVISATVHVDEKTPHMHFSMVPVTKDGRLSAKSIFTKQELQQLHTDFHRSVGSKFGLERGEMGSKAKHIETAELKLKTAQNELERTKQSHDMLKSSINQNIEIHQRLAVAVEKKKKEYVTLKELIDRYNKAIEEKADKSTLDRLKAEISKEKALEYINTTGQKEAFENYCKNGFKKQDKSQSKDMER